MSRVRSASRDMALPDFRRAARRPSRQERLRAFLLSLLAALRSINLSGLAAQVSYSLIFSLPSILLILALAVNSIDERTGFAISDEVRGVILAALPLGVQPVVSGLVDDAMTRARQGPSTISAIVAIVVALVAAGNGLGELATAFDRAAGIVDHRPAWLQRAIFTASAVLIALMLVVAFTLYVWGGDLVALIAAQFRLATGWAEGWQALQGLVVLVLVMLGTTLLYMTSSGRYHFRETAPGAVVATLIWLIVVKGFQFYLQVANPGTAYGAASSVLVFLVFLYVSSLGLIVGAMIAAVTVRESREAAVTRTLLQAANTSGPEERGNG